jgi:hypothetical protein
MLGPALVLVSLALAIEAHVRGRDANRAAIRRALVGFAAGHLIALLALAASGAPRFASASCGAKNG